MGSAGIPGLDIDLFSQEAIFEPYDNYQAIRDAGPLVWLERQHVFALGRYKDVRAVLRDARRFSSAQGVFFNSTTNQKSRGTVIASDADLHTKLRGVIAPPLFPAAVRALTDAITVEADALVERLVGQGRFDAVNDLAWHLPSAIVTRLVGLPEEGREGMREWGTSAFDAGGPEGNARAIAALPGFQAMYAFVAAPDLSDRLLPGSWSARLFAAASDHDIDIQQCISLLIDYVAPSLDTTVSGLSSAIWLFARHPGQWQMIRENPTLIRRAILEVLRIETPIRAFTRVATEDVDFAGTTLPAGARVAVLYASANRDEDKWPRADAFDIMREGLNDHLAFGNGEHICVGMHLAQLEISAILTALAKRVSRFEVGQVERLESNLLRGFSSLPVTVTT